MSAAYMPFFVADYLADTAHLSAVEHGAYLLLIMNYWQRQKPLPADDRKLARIARVTDEQWQEMHDTIEEFFTEVDGEWQHKRIETELTIVGAKIEKAKAAGKASAATRRASVEQTINDRSTDVQPLGKARIEEKKEVSEASLPRPGQKPRTAKSGLPIDDFWLPYPRTPNMSKAECQKVWLKLSEADQRKAIDAVEGYKHFLARKPDHPAVHACRFLSQRRFEGFEEEAAKPSVAVPKQVFVAFGTPAWKAWQSVKRTASTYSAEHGENGWYFPAEYPEQASEAA